jgi:hypothetical protein
MLDKTTEFILILANYDPEEAKRIEERHQNGIDVLDELYEALCVHDELAAEAYNS